MNDDLYRAHDSIQRNRLIAKTKSWMGYVDKSGGGTGSIVDKCVAQGLARPDFEPTVGFFRTVVWRNGTQSAPSLNPVTGARVKNLHYSCVAAETIDSATHVNR